MEDKAGTPEARFMTLMDSLEKLLPVPMAVQLRSDWLTEQWYLERIATILEEHKALMEENERLREAAALSLKALDSVCCIYTADMCGEEAVERAQEYIGENGGTVAVWAKAAQKLRAALQDKSSGATPPTDGGA